MKLEASFASATHPGIPEGRRRSQHFLHLPSSAVALHSFEDSQRTCGGPFAVWASDRDRRVGRAPSSEPSPLPPAVYLCPADRLVWYNSLYERCTQERAGSRHGAASKE